jgi:hypothetical protein
MAATQLVKMSTTAGAPGDAAADAAMRDLKVIQQCGTALVRRTVYVCIMQLRRGVRVCVLV